MRFYPAWREGSTLQNGEEFSTNHETAGASQGKNTPAPHTREAVEAYGCKQLTGDEREYQAGQASETFLGSTGLTFS